ncbi:hypothetical protein CAEBREN_19005 [Caenorhabditis brenneri]|uniref:Uncharacterized protein n=1 Tax=Caenorhabditis brenneri TaxID=135651 RepID=G0P1P2_CAEBE|nr:hypothetical protein CAEBREN_19005 [Caenorhabditis brenneri]
MAPNTTTTYATVVKNGYSWPELCKFAPQAPSLEAFHITNGQVKLQKVECPKNGAGVKFQSKQVESKITSQVCLFENGAPGSEFNGHRDRLGAVSKELQKALTASFPDVEIWQIGSFAAGFDIPSSDLDFTIKVESLAGCKTPAAKLNIIKEKLAKEQEAFNVKRVVGGRVPVLVLQHRATQIDVDVTIDNDTPKLNTQFLIWYSQVDARVAPLVRAVKYWASETGVECSKKGRLNSFSICLLVIHFLQKGVSPAVLPNLQETFPEINGEIKISADPSKRRHLAEDLRRQGWSQQNTDSLGALYLGFFQYYRKFDFTTRWISIKRGTSLVKRYAKDRSPTQVHPRGYIVVEDPFLITPWNCAGTVRQGDIFQRIIEEFQKSYDLILNHKTIFFRNSVRREVIVKEGKERDRLDWGWINRYTGRYYPWENIFIDFTEAAIDWEKRRTIGRWEPWPEQMAWY